MTGSITRPTRGSATAGPRAGRVKDGSGRLSLESGLAGPVGKLREFQQQR